MYPTDGQALTFIEPNLTGLEFSRFTRFPFFAAAFPPATVYFLGIESWLRETMTCLPESWDVTSDSIAVVLARFFGASELTLLKSALPPTQTTLTQLMDLEFVDRYFKEAITSAVTEQLSNIGRVKFVNLRDENYAEHCLSCHSAH